MRATKNVTVILLLLAVINSWAYAALESLGSPSDLSRFTELESVLSETDESSASLPICTG